MSRFYLNLALRSLRSRVKLQYKVKTNSLVFTKVSEAALALNHLKDWLILAQNSQAHSRALLYKHTDLVLRHLSVWGFESTGS